MKKRICSIIVAAIVAITSVFISEIPAQAANTKQMDVILCIGQSNMAGRASVSDAYPEEAPSVPVGGYEYKAITAPNTLSELKEPFGKYENKEGGIDDGTSKRGGLVAAFANAYYATNGNVPAVYISASKGNTVVLDWQPDAPEGYLKDAIERLNSCMKYLRSQGISVRHRYVIWCQGEADATTDPADYVRMFNTTKAELKKNGIEKILMVRIGQNNNLEEFPHTRMIKLQTDMCKSDKDVVMVSTAFAGMAKQGLMRDDYHYYQMGYNIAGKQAGAAAGYYALTGVEPSMYDPEYNNTYTAN